MSRLILTGDCIEQMRSLPDASIDAVVTDPPYGIGFMGHEWDQPGEFAPITANGNPQPFASTNELKLQRQMERAQRRGSQRSPAVGAGHARDRARARAHPDGRWQDERAGGGGGAMHAGRYDLSPSGNRRFQEWTQAWATEAYRVLKPGGHLASFASTRTWHRMTAGIEDAGYEIRDMLTWLFGSGFPKSLNFSEGEWTGWGTALKPCHEPIVLARKPLQGTVAECLAAFGTGAINVNASRIAAAGAKDRWPANVLIDDAAAELIDAQSGMLTSGANPTRRGADKFRDVYGAFGGQEQAEANRGTDVGGASRFYYCAKANRAERDQLVAELLPRTRNVRKRHQQDAAGRWYERLRNRHPTVKPLDLMRWLAVLVTPPGGTILDPFLGSGTTAIAAELSGFDFVGCERNLGYVLLAKARLAWWEEHPDAGDDLATELARIRREAERTQREAHERAAAEAARAADLLLFS